MNTISRMVTGIIGSILAIIVIISGYGHNEYFPYIFGSILLVFSIIIILNKSEDDIEQVEKVV